MLSTTLRRVLVASGLAVTTSFMTALSASANTVNSSAQFTKVIDPSIAIITDFASKTTAAAYTPTAYATSGAGGVSQLQKTDTITFNSNSDTVGVTLDVPAGTLISPPAINATQLVGVHTALVTSSVGTETITKTGAGSPTAVNFITDVQGNLTLTVQSTWVPQPVAGAVAAGQELINGTYSATVALSVVAN